MTPSRRSATGSYAAPMRHALDAKPGKKNSTQVGCFKEWCGVKF